MADDTIGLGRTCRIVIDPGHGGSYTGAVANGCVEKDLNLQIALRLAPLLRGEGHTVFLTRQADTHLGSPLKEDLKARTRLSRDRSADLFVSIHHDWMSSPGSGGCHGFAHRETYRNGMDLAGKIAKAVHDMHGIGYSYGGPAGQHWDNLGVFSYNSNAQYVTCALIECLTLTNPNQAAIAKSPAYADRTALAIAQGIHRHLGLADPGEQPPATIPVKIVKHGTTTVLATIHVVPNGLHIDDQRKIYVADESLG